MMSDYIEGGSDDCVRDDNTRTVNFSLVLCSSGILRNVSCYLVVTFPYGLSVPSSRVKESTENSSWSASSFFRYVLVITLISNALIYLTVLGSIGNYAGCDSDPSHILPRF